MFRANNKVTVYLSVPLIVAGATLFLLASGRAQTKSAPMTPRPGQYLGAVSCASGGCHGNVKPKNPKDEKFRVRLDEYFTWIKFDRHSKAYNVLLEDKAKNILANMARFRDQKSKAQEIPLCLNCHALPRESHAKPLDLSQGVSCEACHGAASGWVSTHTEARSNTRKQSLNAGMTNVWDPKARAQTCLECHLGTLKKPDKNVDHELIAAGHPDLRFELDNYADQMPRHWASYAERVNKSGREENEGARAWLVGQTVAFKMGLARLADRARKDNWPEYAELDCYACHHSLQEKSWRQPSGRKENLGLPPWSRARFVMLRAIIAVFAPEKLAGIEADANKLASAIHRSSGAEVAKLAANLEQAMAPVIAEAEMVKTVDTKQASQFVDLIVKDIVPTASDIRSAEQAVFAVNTLATDIYRAAPQNEAALRSALDALAKTVEAPATYTPANFIGNMKRVQEALNRIGNAKN